MSLASKRARRVARTFLVWGVWGAVGALVACGGDPLGAFSDASVETLVVAPSTSTIAIGSTVQLSATLRDAGGAALSRTVTWASDAESVATVSAAGIVRGVSPGRATIRARSGTTTATALVAVETDPAGEDDDEPKPRPRAGFYATPGGSSAADGSFGKPWDLATALSGGNGRVQPGDTIWLRGGTYKGTFRPSVTGAPGKPVVVRGYPGERAILDAAGSSKTTLFVLGAYTVYWGFEITNSHPVRSGGRAHGIANYASHTKYINLIVHDGGVALYTEPTYADVEIAGCIIYNNGYQDSDRGHGHALYLKNNAGPVVARDNVMFNQFGYGVHGYSNAGSGRINNVRLEGNVVFNSGTLSTNSTASNILLGGYDPADDGVVDENFTYSSPGVANRNVHIGYDDTKNGSVVVRDNYFVGGATVLEMGYWSDATVTGNTLAGRDTMVQINNSSRSGQVWSNDLFNRDPAASAWMYGGSTYSFSGWKSATGFTTAGQAVSGMPTTTRVFVRRNPYEAGRAHIVVYNWGKLPAVSVDLASIVPLGGTYEIRNVQDLFGSPVLTGIYAGGLLALPITAVAPPVPVGLSKSRSPSTGTEFNVYLVTIR